MLRSLEAQLDVGVVLEDREAVLPRQLEQSLALLERQGAAGRVLEVGYDVRELRARPGLEGPGESVDVDAVCLELYRQDLRTQLAQCKERAVVGRRLYDHDVAGLDQRLEQERVGLHGAVRSHGSVRLDALLVGDPLEQARVAGRRSVREGPTRVALEGPVGRRAKLVDGDDVKRGSAAGERDIGQLGHEAPRYRPDSYLCPCAAAPTRSWRPSRAARWARSTVRGTSAPARRWR